MKTVIIILTLLIILYLVTAQMKPAAASSCPDGYAPSPVNSTWAGWSYNCLPSGIESSLVGVPSDTYVRPITTIYKPVVAGTGYGASTCGEPARMKEFAGHPSR